MDDEKTPDKATKKGSGALGRSVTANRSVDEFTPVKESKMATEVDIYLTKGSGKKICVDVYGPPRGRSCTNPCDPAKFDLTFDETPTQYYGQFHDEIEDGDDGSGEDDNADADSNDTMPPSPRAAEYM